MGTEIGIIGALLIFVAWALETIKSVRRHKSLIDLQFSVIILLGTLFLLAYSLQINDFVFIWVNMLLAGVETFEIVYSIYVRKLHRRLRD
jgi:lipid-A-disaccharide synthase-like uncharacterized protein